MGKKHKADNKQKRQTSVKKPEGKKSASSSSLNGLRKSDFILKWISFELALLKRLVYRNKNQHRSSDFMKHICKSCRCLTRFTGYFKKTKSTTELTKLHKNDEFNALYYKSLKSVLDTSISLSRLHSHHFHVPLVTVLICVYGRLLFLLKRVPVFFGITS
ncbi:hypothetical protein BgAZ_305220 [Babesia gibsoni]|uniref:Uncharacterized protein n=1 Tax=Babesia gibsoni TaxID=33632 RepID=A0AAD8LLG7_BABGI|nr:hypothetical protein BgAZ_305220 [Babesia gibsoni]